MAFQGDLKTFPLPDLLQWLDASRKPGRLTLSYGGGERLLYLQGGIIERFGAPGLYERLARLVRLVGVGDERAVRAALERAQSGVRLEDALASAGFSDQTLRAIARDDAFQAAIDLFEDPSGTFHFSDDLEFEEDETAQVEIGIRELLYEAARRLDEAAAAAQAVGSDSVSVRRAKPADERVTGLSAAALAAIGAGSTVGAVRLALGLSRTGAARILHDLWRDGFLTLDGTDEKPREDPLTHMLRQGEQLLADGHYEAAALVFNSLLTTDPTDRRVREFARAVEREHVEALYRRLLPVAVPTMLAAQASLAALRPDERIVASLVNGRWDVSTLVLASPLRELQTLRAIERMVELGFVALR